MKEIATIASRMRTSVRQKILTNLAGDNLSKMPATMAPRKQPVPVAESQLKSYLAASGVGLDTTGTALKTSPWS
jgi:hypothetical protein